MLSQSSFKRSGLFGLVAVLVISGPAAAQFSTDGIVGDIVRDEIGDAIGDRAAEMLEDQILGSEEEEAAPPPPRASSGGGGDRGPRLASAADPEEVRQSIELHGTAELSTDRSGAPFISGRMEGELYRVSFHGCESGDDCRHIVFQVGFADAEATLEDVNDWNASALFGTAYLDDAGLARLKMSVNLEGGVAIENLDLTVERWRIALVEFRGFINR